MLFTGDPLPDVARGALAVEPMTCPPNAFNSNTAVTPRTRRIGIRHVGHQHDNMSSVPSAVHGDGAAEGDVPEVGEEVACVLGAGGRRVADRVVARVARATHGGGS